MDRFSLQTGLSVSQRHELTIQPRMLQAIEVLQLPALELSSFLREEFEKNEALSLDEPGLESGGNSDAEPSGEAGAEGGADTSAAETQDNESYGERAGFEGPRGTREDSERHDEMLRNQPAREHTVVELVEEQLPLADIAPALLPWVRLLVHCLDDDGYLTPDDDQLLALAEEAGLEGGAERLGPAIAALQSLEPRGIGGRNAVEALLLQLDPADPDYAQVCRLLEDFLDDVLRNKLPAVARAMGLELAEVLGLVERLRELEPRPAASLDAGTAEVLRPDIVVESVDSGFEVRLEEGRLPAVSVDAGVRALSRDAAQPAEVRTYLRGKVDRARWLVEAVEQRRETLLRVAQAVFAHQRAFLEHGPGHLVPLRMTDVAEWLSLHVSTVSRAVAGKHVQTPWGIEPLRWFFQSSAGDAADSARTDVCDEVRRVIEAEDPAAPLSDEDVAELMEQRGLHLARRTVAKYRKELGIASSYRRRRYDR